MNCRKSIRVTVKCGGKNVVAEIPMRRWDTKELFTTQIQLPGGVFSSEADF